MTDKILWRRLTIKKTKKSKIDFLSRCKIQIEHKNISKKTNQTSRRQKGIIIFYWISSITESVALTRRKELDGEEETAHREQTQRD